MWLLEEKYQGEKSAAFFTDCGRLEAGEPLAYIIGSIPFLNCTIDLQSHPLIPRPETEYWVEKAIAEIQNQPRTSDVLGENLDDDAVAVRVLDLCAGSGAIGVAIAKAIPEAHITFGEIDTNHLPTIIKNLEENIQNMSVNRHILYDRFKVLEADLFTVKKQVRGLASNLGDSSKDFKLHFKSRNLSSRQDLELGLYDYILCNPPYIDPALDRAEATVKNHEPHLALYGGTGGMEIIERIVAGARASLAPHGQLWLEHEPEQSAAISALAHTHHFSCETKKDQYEVERYSILVIQ